MKNAIITLLVLLPAIVWGQMGHPSELSPEKRKEIEGMKVAYLTSQMDLSPEEAQVFWPVYNQFRDEMDAHRSEGRKKYQLFKINESELSDEELIEQMESRFDHERERIAIEEKYFKQFVEILSPQKVLAMMEAEEGFKRELLRKVRGERPERGSGGR
ncbi:hypothetical protein O3Q51_06275 [Cryomorphaceae bacterium 1068]|nr:hypothetical protein [Cryomorphaceae bacterium 1068]